jgi:hypothetical protein
MICCSMIPDDSGPAVPQVQENESASVACSSRRRLNRRVAARLVLQLVASVAIAPPAHAEFQSDYALGLKALDDGRYVDARRYLERALAARPEPVDKVMLNGNIEQPYLPYHFLGMAAYQLGDCDDARTLWANPMNVRMIGRLHQVRQQEQRLIGACQPRAKGEPSSTGSSALVTAPEPAPATQAPPVIAPTPAATPAAPPAAAPSVATQPAPVTPAPQVRERASAATPAEVDKRTQTAAAPVEHAPPPPPLVQAFESYLAGRYEDAAGIDPDALSGARARFHALLIRAAARYTQAQLDGSKALLAIARADAIAARALDPRALPNAAAFSPRFRAFYAAAR